MLATKRAVIRVATGDDLDGILDCLMEFAVSMAYRMIPVGAAYAENPRPYMAWWITRQLATKPTAIFVAEDEGAIVGICAGSIVDFPMVPDFPHLWEWAWYVRPEHASVKMSLWKHLSAWAKRSGAKGSVCGNPESRSSTTMTERLHWRIWG